MNLIPRRKQDPTTLERAAKAAKLGAHGLTAQRVARRGHTHYKRGKRILTLSGLAAIAVLIAKKVRGGGEAPDTSSYSPPASSGAPAGTSAAAAATAATGTPPVNGDGAAAAPDVSDALADAGVEGSGPDTPEEAGAALPAASDASVEAAPPPTDDTLDVEAPNEGTPPPGKTKK